MDLPEEAKRPPSAPVWNQSFPSLWWICLKRLSDVHLPRFGIKVFLLLRHCLSAASSLSGATLLSILEGVPLSATWGRGWLPYCPSSPVALPLTPPTTTATAMAGWKFIQLLPSSCVIDQKKKRKTQRPLKYKTLSSLAASSAVQNVCMLCLHRLSAWLSVSVLSK